MTFCPNKEKCGSCSWSHIPYDKQLKQKLSDINGSLALKKLDLRCDFIIPSPKLEHYRNRMDFAIDFQGRVGLKERGKWWRVIDGHTCFLAMDIIEDLFAQTRTWVKESDLSCWDRKANVGFLRYAVIRATTLGETMVNIITSTPKSENETLKARSILKWLAEKTNATTVLWTQNSTITDVSFGEKYEIISGQGFITEIINGVQFQISPQAFFQTNPFAAQSLLETVKNFCGDLRDKALLDLYCGTGFFSVAFAKNAKMTIGVEFSNDAVADARINAKLNDADIEYHDAKTEDFDWAGYKPDIVILDPPRSGMHDNALNDVLRICPNEIVYVSCNPKNFAREMVMLGEKYRVTQMLAVDMFPHTPHVELVSKLETKKPHG